jgi:hypothetical protein
VPRRQPLEVQPLGCSRRRCLKLGPMSLAPRLDVERAWGRSEALSEAA